MSEGAQVMRYPSQPKRRRSRCRLILASCASAYLLAQVPSAQSYPIYISRPTITGKLEVGQTLTATTGTWTDSTGSPIVRYEYEWSSCIIQTECLITGLGEGEGPHLLIPPELEGMRTEVSVEAIDAEGKINAASSEETAVITGNIPHYAVSENVSGGGSVTGAADEQTSAAANMNLDCPGLCGAGLTYASGTSVELVAHPEEGATFLGWGGACSGSAPTCSFIVSDDVTVSASFTSAPLPNGGPLPVLEGREADEPGESGGPASGGAAAGARALDGEGEEAPSSSADHLPARLLGLRALPGHDHRLQATVACQQARTCRMTLAVSAGGQLVASRAITLAAGRRASVGFALDSEGVLLLARRHQLPVTAHLVLREGARSVGVGGARLTLVA